MSAIGSVSENSSDSNRREGMSEKNEYAGKATIKVEGGYCRIKKCSEKKVMILS